MSDVSFHLIGGVHAKVSSVEPRLVKAAHEFEAAMMKELMSRLQPKANAWGDEADNSSENALTSFASDALSQAISMRGGFGIADRVIHQISQQSNHSGNSPVPVLPAARTVLHLSNDYSD